MIAYARLAWRNLWRFKRRNLFAIFLAGAGFFLFLFYYAFMMGYTESFKNSMLESIYSDILISHKNYDENFPFKNLINFDEKYIEKIKKIEGVKEVSARLIFSGTVFSAYRTEPSLIIGIIPEREKDISNWYESIVEGEYLTSNDRFYALVPKEFADKAKLRKGKRISVMIKNYKNEIESKIFKVKGILQAPFINEGIIFVNLKDLQEITGYKNKISGYYVKVKRESYLESVKKKIQEIAGSELSVKTWSERIPYLKGLYNLSRWIMFIYLSFLFIAAAIGILNIFYMNMSERTREFGLLLSIGVTPRRVFYLILIESFYITTLGIIAGGILISVVYPIWSKFGLDLSLFEKGLEYLGVSKYVYPFMDIYGIIFSLVLIYFFGILASVYPAIKASRLSPAKAMRFVR